MDIITLKKAIDITGILLASGAFTLLFLIMASVFTMSELPLNIGCDDYGEARNPRHLRCYYIFLFSLVSAIVLEGVALVVMCIWYVIIR